MDGPILPSGRKMTVSQNSKGRVAEEKAGDQGQPTNKHLCSQDAAKRTRLHLKDSPRRGIQRVSMMPRNTYTGESICRFSVE